jgi:hypothetical protein
LVPKQIDKLFQVRQIDSAFEAEFNYSFLFSINTNYGIYMRNLESLSVIVLSTQPRRISATNAAVRLLGPCPSKADDRRAATAVTTPPFPKGLGGD